MLFCQPLEITTCGVDIYSKLSNYFDLIIKFRKTTLCLAADGALLMISQNTGCLKLIKDSNPSMLVMHCVIHRENFTCTNVSPILHEILHCVIKYINSIKASSKAERLFQKFCKANHVRLLLPGVWSQSWSRKKF